MPAPLLLSPSFAVVLRVVDAVAFALLLLFILWGLRRGALRQVLSLGVLIGALIAASELSPRIEGTVAKVASLTLAERQATAWGAVLFATLVAGAVLLSFACCRLPERSEGAAGRLLAAVLGGVQGALVLLVLGYAVLGAGPQEPAPSLARPSGPVASPAPQPGSAWFERLRGSVTAAAMARGADLVGGWAAVPPWIAAYRLEVDQRLQQDPLPGVRPRDRRR